MKLLLFLFTLCCSFKEAPLHSLQGRFFIGNFGSVFSNVYASEDDGEDEDQGEEAEEDEGDEDEEVEDGEGSSGGGVGDVLKNQSQALATEAATNVINGALSGENPEDVLKGMAEDKVEDAIVANDPTGLAGQARDAQNSIQDQMDNASGGGGGGGGGESGGGSSEEEENPKKAKKRKKVKHKKKKKKKKKKKRKKKAKKKKKKKVKKKRKKKVKKKRKKKHKKKH